MSNFNNTPILTSTEKRFLDKYNLYDEYKYDVHEEKIINIVYPSTSKLTTDQETYILDIISKKYPERHIRLDNRTLTIDDKTIHLNCIHPLLSEAVYNFPDNSELKRFSVDIDFKTYNITEKKTQIKFGLISTVVYNENFLNDNSTLVSYDTNPCWYHIYDFEPKHFYGIDFHYYLVQPKFSYEQIITSIDLSDSDKLDVLAQLSLL